ncbi:MAG: DNA repair protein RecN [Spirochaetaceae bacterium]|jgi:DNA repair protein RecN (Recombination protein N)|nr:DNA repair protein RecN [Spirochaetaceae bacterium]
MLEELSVRNYALIENITLSFEDGLNIITGETGAGKSIIVGALGFLLGAKSAADAIRTGADETGVSAVVALGQAREEAREWLSARDIPLEDGRLIVRRSLKTNGRGSIFIQNVPVSRADLAEFMALLFDIHGQHDHESLLRRETHRKYLDRFAGLEEEAARFNAVFTELSEKRRAVEAAQTSTREREARIELLKFAVDEISRAALKNNESRDLEAEAARLASFEKLASCVEAGARMLFEEELSVLSLSRKARASLESAAAIDDSLSVLEQRLSAMYFEADDIAREVRSYRESLSFDPDRLECVEQRLSFIYKLKKKYAKSAGIDTSRSPEEAILAYKDEAESEIEALSVSEENREKLKTETAALEREIALMAKALTAKREAASGALSRKIAAVLFRLGMTGAGFAVRLEPKTENAGRLLLGPYGADDIEFLISANQGEPLKELARIASGGELSRVMLAIKSVLAGGEADKDNSPGTLIFDEVDTGIGGEVAITVGEELYQIARRKQVFCITHLASIACRADHHLIVEKTSDGQRTSTTVRELDRESRREEIARLLSGERGGAALAHADQLLSKYSGAPSEY